MRLRDAADSAVVAIGNANRSGVISAAGANAVASATARILAMVVVVISVVMIAAVGLASIATIAARGSVRSAVMVSARSEPHRGDHHDADNHHDHRENPRGR